MLRWLGDSFVSGLLVILPIGATAFIVWLIYQFIWNLVGPLTGFTEWVRERTGTWIPGLEIVLTLLLILVVGVLIRYWFGRTLYHRLERLLISTPLLGKLYDATRQLAQLLFRRHVPALERFGRVVMVEYPKKGTYVVGVLTRTDTGRIADIGGKRYVTVYVPTSPNPLSGWLLFVPEEEIAYLDIPVEDVMTMTLSGGAVFPEKLRRKDADQEGR